MIYFLIERPPHRETTANSPGLFNNRIGRGRTATYPYLLCRLKHRSLDRLREVSVNEDLCRVEVVLARFINYTHLTMFFAFHVRNGNINLATFQRNLISGIVQANNETT